MIGLGIIEIGLLAIGGSYIYALLSSKKNRIQYIELDENQFLRLQTTLVANNILPSHMLVNGNQNNNIIPPTYDESNFNYAISQSQTVPNYSPQEPAELPVTDNNSVSIPIIQPPTIEEDSDTILPESTLYRADSV